MALPLSDKLRYVRQRVEQLENKLSKAMSFQTERDRRIESIQEFYVTHIEKLIEDELELKMYKKLIPHPDDPEEQHEWIFKDNLERQFKAHKVLLTEYHEVTRYSTNANLNRMSILEAKNVMKFYSTKFSLNFIYLLEGTGVNTNL